MDQNFDLSMAGLCHCAAMSWGQTVSVIYLSLCSDMQTGENKFYLFSFKINATHKMPYTLLLCYYIAHYVMSYPIISNLLLNILAHCKNINAINTFIFVTLTDNKKSKRICKQPRSKQKSLAYDQYSISEITARPLLTFIPFTTGFYYTAKLCIHFCTP